MKKKQPAYLLSGIILLLVAVSACSGKLGPSKSIDMAEKKDMEKQYYFTEGLKYFELRDFNKANALFRETLKADSSCDACYYRLAEIYLQSGYPEAAVTFSHSAVKLDTANVWYQILLGKSLSAASDTDKAIAVFEKIMQNSPQHPKLHYHLALLYAGKQQHQKALQHLDTLSQKTGIDYEALLLRFEILQETGEHQEAINTLTLLGTYMPNERIYTMLSEIHSNANHDSLSLYYVKKALEINPDYPPALLSEVDFYRRSQHFDTYFSKMYAIYANPNIPKEMKTEYLTALLKVPNFTQIFQQQFDTLFSQIRTKPYAEIEPLYGNFLIQTGRSDSASVVFQQAAAYFNTEILWETFLGFLYYRQAWDKLETHATEALRIFPERINFITLKAIALWQKNKIRQAIELLEKAIPLVKNNKEQTLQFCSLLGDLYQLENNIKKTTFYYEQALAIDSTNIPVLNNYAYFLSEHGKDLEKAYRMSEKTIAAEPNNATYLDTLGWILYKLNQYVAAKTIFRRAMIYGGTDSAVILDHYGDVLYAAGEKEAAVVYWELSYKKVPNPEVKKKIP